MKNYIFKDKTEDLAIKSAMSSLNIKKEEILYKINYEKNGILNKKCEIVVYKVEDIINNVYEKLENIIKMMDFKPNINIKYDNKLLIINIETDDNKILIGKNGEVLKSLKTIIYSYIKRYIDINVKIDVGSYQKTIDEKFIKNIKKIIKEVKITGVPYKLDSLNSYQRKLIHDVASNYENISTKSYGEEPDRYIEIKRM